MVYAGRRPGQREDGDDAQRSLGAFGGRGGCTGGGERGPADTLHVPSEYSTIQAAIDAASSGDVVEIADGTYTGTGNKNLDFGGKAITVRSVSGNPAMCVIDCEGDGRGFYFHNDEGNDSIVDGLTIANGYSDYGGGVYCEDDSSPTLRKCTFQGNTAFEGGGILIDWPSGATLTNCVFSGNTADYDGGALTSVGENVSVTNCVFSGNTANEEYGFGGAMAVSGNFTVANCTFCGNTASQGLDIDAYDYHGDPVTIENCILWGSIYDWNDVCNVSYSCVRGGFPGTGNICRNPRFIDADGPDDIPGTLDDNLRVQANSPCNNMGSDAAVSPDIADLDGDSDTTEPTPFDLDGNNRFVGIVDMGAYEHSAPTTPPAVPTLVYVDADAPAGGDGLSWATACTHLQDALDMAESGTTIWVAMGTYYPDRHSITPAGTANRCDSFWLADGVVLHGGFLGGETSLSQRPRRSGSSDGRPQLGFGPQWRYRRARRK